MVTISTKRGTATTKAVDVKNWAGETFQNFEKARLSQIKDETLTTNRGTSTIKVEDIPTPTKKDLKGQKITTNRGTSVRTL